MSLMNRMVFGKDNKPDLEKKNYKAKRFDLFFDVLRARFLQMIQLNALLLLSLLPLIVWAVISLFAVSSYMDQNQLIASNLNFIPPWDEHMKIIYTHIYQYMMINIPLLALAGPPIAAATCVLRRWALDEHADAWSDYIEQIKKNWKQPMLWSAVNGLVIFLSFIAINYYTSMAAEQGSVPALLAVYVIYSLWALMAMANLYAFPIMVSYKVGFKQLVRNSLVFAIARLPFSVLLLAAILLTVFWLLTGYAIVTILFYLVMGFTLMGLIIVSYVNATFDKFVVTPTTRIGT